MYRRDYAEKNGLSVNKQFSGHHVGKVFHRLPNILHYRKSSITTSSWIWMRVAKIGWVFCLGNREEGVMQVGDCFTIEPCLVQGVNARGYLWDDGWTLSTEVRGCFSVLVLTLLMLV